MTIYEAIEQDVCSLSPAVIGRGAHQLSVGGGGVGAGGSG